MKNHSCLPGCTKGIKSICGTTIDIDDVDFGPLQNHLLYMDKVYSKGQGTACPLVFNITTVSNKFQSQLLMAPMTHGTNNLCEEIFGNCCNSNRHSHSDCNPTCNLGCNTDCNPTCDSACNNDCSCNSGCQNNCNCNSNCHNDCDCGCSSGTCHLDSNAVFKIVKSYVRVRSFDLTSNCGLCVNQVTIDGSPVDSLSCQGGAYEAGIRQSVPDIVKPACMEQGLPTKAFFLITGAGPWSYQADFVLEGTVNTGGKVCCFRAIFSTTCKIAIPSAVSNLAVPKISIPCISGGISPRLFFGFSGKMNLLNPCIHVVDTDDCDAPGLVLTSAIAAEPIVDVEVIKKSLFCIDGCEAMFPCNGTEEFIENQEDDDNDDSLYGPSCRCGSRKEKKSVCERLSENIESCGCGNNNTYGMSSCSSCCRGY